MHKDRWVSAHSYDTRQFKSHLQLPGVQQQVMLNKTAILSLLKIGEFNSLSILTSGHLGYKDPDLARSSSHIQTDSEHLITDNLMPRLIVNFNPPAMQNYQKTKNFEYPQQVNHLLKKTLVRKGIANNSDVIGSVSDGVLFSAEYVAYKDVLDRATEANAPQYQGALALLGFVILTHFFVSNGVRVMSESKSSDPKMRLFIGSKLSNIARLYLLGLITTVAAPSDASKLE